MSRLKPRPTRTNKGSRAAGFVTYANHKTTAGPSSAKIASLGMTAWGKGAEARCRPKAGATLSAPQQQVPRRRKSPRSG